MLIKLYFINSVLFIAFLIIIPVKTGLKKSI